MANKTIDIATVQNVTIRYELASVKHRIVSTCIDSGCAVFLLFIITSIAGSTSNGEANLFGGYVMFIWLYHFFFILFFNGHTLGMRWMGTRIMSVNGRSVLFSDFFLRWILRPLDITLSAGAIGMFSMLSTDRRQRLGDLLAGTVVVVEKPSVHFSLFDILKSHQEYSSTEVQYPQVRFVKEEDMLMLKNLIQNPKGYSLSVKSEAIHLAAVKMSELLNIDTVPKDEKGFLLKLINDYIILTR